MVFVTPKNDALIVAVVFALTALVEIANVAELAPGATVTFTGTSAADFVLARVTETPLAGAGPLSVTFPTALVPPRRLLGVTLSAASEAGFTVSDALFVTPE